MDHVLLKLQPNHLAYIRQLIGKCPFDEVAPIIAAIQHQVAAQVEQHQKLEQAKTDAAQKAKNEIGKKAAAAVIADLKKNNGVKPATDQSQA